MSKIDSKQIVYINSKDRIQGHSHDFTFSINLKPDNKFDRVTLLQAAIPKSYYGVSTGLNYFTLTENLSSIVIEIPIGNYNRNSLSNILQDELNDNSPLGYDYVVSYPNANSEGDDGKYTITVSNNLFQPSITFDSITDMYEILGFDQSTTYPFSGNILTSVNVINLQPISCVQIHSNIVNNPYATGVNTDILQTIVANTGSAPFSNIAWTCWEFESYSQYITSNNTGSCRFFLTDEDNHLLDLNGIDIQLVLMFWKKNTALLQVSDFIRYFVHQKEQSKFQ